MLPNYFAEQFPIITTGTIVFDLVPYFVLIETSDKIPFEGILWKLIYEQLF